MKHTDSMEYNSLRTVKFNRGKTHTHTHTEMQYKCPKKKDNLDTETFKGKVQRGYLEIELLY